MSFLLAILAASILFWVNKEQSHSKRLLILLLIILSVPNMQSVLLYSGQFIRFPWLFRVSTPFTLLIAPVSYIYIRSVLRNELTFRKNDWWLLLPGVLFALNFIPYYLLPYEAKQSHLIELYKAKFLQSRFDEGILPPFYFSFFRVAWSSFFILNNYWLIRQFKRKSDKQVLVNNKKLVQWLSILNWLLFGLLISALAGAIISPIFRTNYSVLDFALGLTVLVICIQLFRRPNLLYGIFDPLGGKSDLKSLDYPEKENLDQFVPDGLKEGIEVQKIEFDKALSPLAIIDSEGYSYKRTLESLFFLKKTFLQPDYSLERMVYDTKIPRYILSAFINRQYGMGFREYLNRYRVEYFMEKVKDPKWKHLTLEAISKECGFTSRSTFIKNFKQITGQTPTEFIKMSQRLSASRIG